MTLPLAIVSQGAVTPVGLNAASTCAAIRAHISGYTQSGLFHQSFAGAVSRRLDRIVHARVPLSSPARNDFERVVAFAAMAVEETLAGAGLDPKHCALILGVREPHRLHPDFEAIDLDWIGAIEASLGVRFHTSSCCVPNGHVSVFIGLRRAREWIEAGTVQACIVGGVDTLCNAYDLQRYVGSYRVLGPTVSKGFVPGEGAVFVAVAAAGSPTGSAAAVHVRGVGVAAEDPSTTVLAEGHPTGRGLQQAMLEAVADAGVPESRIDLRVSDLNGESYRIDDSLLASIRFYETYRAHLEIWHPADCVGDLGAASGPMLLVYGCAGLSRGLAPGDVAMCESASDAGLRAGCVLERIPAAEA